MECSTGPGQSVSWEEVEKDYDQSGCMPQQEDGKRVLYQWREGTSFFRA